MKKLFSAFLMVMIASIMSIRAQQAVPTAGGNATGSNGTASYSIGQVVYSSISNDNGSVNQGVQQPYAVSTVGLNNIKDINLICAVYPNPAISLVNLKIDNYNLETLSFQLYDISGKLILNQKIINNETPIPMENLSIATYILKVVDNKEELKTFQIIKN